MQRRKPFRQLRTEEREGRHAAHGREMAGAGVIADERARMVNQRQQFGHVARRGRGRLTSPPPPFVLVGIAGDLHPEMPPPQTGCELPVVFQRPDTDGLPGTGVDQNRSAVTRGGNENFFAWWQGQSQFAGEDAP